MKKIIITTLMITLIVILVSNFSFATTVTVNDLKASFNKIFKEDFSIKIDKGDGGTVSLDNANSKLKYTISDNSVVLDAEGYVIKINYSLEDNKCVLTSKTDLAWYINELKKADVEVTQTEILFVASLLPEVNYSILRDAYLSVVDAVGVDYSLAYTYFYQKIDTNSGKKNVVDTVFNYERTTLEDNETTFKLEIKLDELAALDSSKVKEFPKATVTLGKIDESKDDNNTNTNTNSNSNNVVDKNNVANNTSNKNNSATGDSNTNITTNTNINTNINTNTNIASNTDISTTTNTNSSTNVQVKNEVDWSKLRNTLPKTGSDYPLKHTLISVIFIATALLVLVCMYNKKVGMTDETKR